MTCARSPAQAAMLALMLWPGLAGAEGACANTARARLEANAVGGLVGFEFRVDQVLQMQRDGGPGIFGPWIGTEWTTTTTSPMPDPISRPQPPAGVIPEWTVTCVASHPTPSTLGNQSKGAIPFEVTPEGIFWRGTTVRVGDYYPAAPPTPPVLAINLSPDSPPFDFTMTGTVQGGANMTLGAELFDKRLGVGFDAWADYKVRLSVTPDGGPASQNLKGEVSYTGQSPAPVWSTSRSYEDVIVVLRVQGAALVRDYLERRGVRGAARAGGRRRTRRRGGADHDQRHNRG